MIGPVEVKVAWPHYFDAPLLLRLPFNKTLATWTSTRFHYFDKLLLLCWALLTSTSSSYFDEPSPLQFRKASLLHIFVPRCPPGSLSSVMAVMAGLVGADSYCVHAGTRDASRVRPIKPDIHVGTQRQPIPVSDQRSTFPGTLNQRLGPLGTVHIAG